MSPVPPQSVPGDSSVCRSGRGRTTKVVSVRPSSPASPVPPVPFYRYPSPEPPDPLYGPHPEPPTSLYRPNPAPPSPLYRPRCLPLLSRSSGVVLSQCTDSCLHVLGTPLRTPTRYVVYYSPSREMHSGPLPVRSGVPLVLRLPHSGRILVLRGFWGVSLSTPQTDPGTTRCEGSYSTRVFSCRHSRTGVHPSPWDPNRGSR